VRGVGGLAIDMRGATSVPGLYAAGDAASREPVVGAVSGGGGPNSTWAIASGVWAGRLAAVYAKGLGRHLHDRTADALGQAGLSGDGCADTADISQCIKAVQAEMFPLDRNFTREGAGMRGSVARLNEVWSLVRATGDQRQNGKARYRSREAAAMTATARWIYAGALARTESRGIHRRRDYPTIDVAQSRRLETRGLDDFSVGPAARTP
jgi:succinate dehydrogenase/fumarate reductase flavoprotein subunit